MRIEAYSQQPARPSPYLHVGYISAQGMAEDLGGFFFFLLGACALAFILILGIAKR